ncbi:MAG: hypothetical protein J5I35_11050 [Methanothrix harundinacea]|nr:hypothetical protein [Methanothrix harundinacea]
MKILKADSSSSGERVTAGDVVRFCRGEDFKGIDLAVPQSWFEDMRRLNILSQFVYSYQEVDGSPTFGRPVSLGDMLLQEVSEGRAVVLKAVDYYALRDLARGASDVNPK